MTTDDTVRNGTPTHSDLDQWWNGLTDAEQAEALTIPQKLPAWMSSGEKASEILVNWPAGERVPGDYGSETLREFLECKRSN